MKKTKKCPKCGSGNIIANARVLDHGVMGAPGKLIIETGANPPETRTFQGKSSTPVAAWVCTECGYVELYAMRRAVE